MKLSLYSAALVTFFAGASTARPQGTINPGGPAILPLPACVSNCISQIVGNGTCVMSDTACVCSQVAFNLCVQDGCSAGLIDPTGQYCNSTSSSASGSPTGTASLSAQASTLTFNPGGPLMSVGPATTTTSGGPTRSTSTGVTSPSSTSKNAAGKLNVQSVQVVFAATLAFVGAGLMI